VPCHIRALPEDYQFLTININHIKPLVSRENINETWLNNYKNNETTWLNNL